jgi:hypothetical protein
VPSANQSDLEADWKRRCKLADTQVRRKSLPPLEWNLSIPSFHLSRFLPAYAKSETRAYLLTVVVGIAVLLALENAFHSVDYSGWITHRRDTPVWIQGNWMAGESRICEIPLAPGNTLPSSAHLLCGQGGGEALDDSFPADFIGILSSHEFFELAAGNWKALDRRFHVLPVTYWGRIDRNDRIFYLWRCVRQETSLVCKALN